MGNKLTHEEFHAMVKAALEEAQRTQRASAQGGRAALQAFLGKGGGATGQAQPKPGQLVFGGQAGGMPQMPPEMAPSGMEEPPMTGGPTNA